MTTINWNHTDLFPAVSVPYGFRPVVYGLSHGNAAGLEIKNRDGEQRAKVISFPVGSAKVELEAFILPTKATSNGKWWINANEKKPSVADHTRLKSLALHTQMEQMCPDFAQMVDAIASTMGFKVKPFFYPEDANLPATLSAQVLLHDVTIFYFGYFEQTVSSIPAIRNWKLVTE